ncbi:MAG: PilZ domain-containing protein [Gemmatimonadaceae bacterium]|nr:PilZ domain-containing protein [Gemmatimonadaceae bacterium]
MNERRVHRRLSIRLPLECSPAGVEGEILRATAANISTGGLYFEVEVPEGSAPPAPRSLLEVALSVPPGEGHFPYEGRVSSTARVVRCDVLEAAAGAGPGTRRLGIAASFCEPLKLSF